MLKIEPGRGSDKNSVKFWGAVVNEDKTIQPTRMLKKSPKLKLIANNPIECDGVVWEPSDTRDIRCAYSQDTLWETTTDLATRAMIKRQCRDDPHSETYDTQIGDGHSVLLNDPSEILGTAMWSVLAIDIEVIAPDGSFPDPLRHEILQISLVSRPRNHSEIHGVVLSHADDARTYKLEDFTLETFESEKSMLSRFVDLVLRMDPDMITGWNVLNFDLWFIATRANICVVPMRLGRDGSRIRAWKKETHTRAHGTRVTKMFDAHGRIIFDSLAVFQKILSEPSYKLQSMVVKHLGKSKEDMPYAEIFPSMRTHEGRLRVASYCYTDSLLVLELLAHFKILHRFSGIVSVTGCPLNKVIHGGQQIRCFSALLREVRTHSPGTAFPDTEEVFEGTYQGATVITPRVGATEDVIATLDFAALYPNIMRAWNMCWSTMITNLPPRGKQPTDTCPYGETEMFRGHTIRRVTTIRAAQTHFDTIGFMQDHEGLIPRVQTKLFWKRKAVKKQMKTSEGLEYEILDAYQLALKLVMNSMYGLLGAKQGYLPEKRIASAITCSGRMLIEWSRLYTETHEAGLSVWGGDTDSIFVHAPKGTRTSPNDYHVFWQKLAQDITATYGHEALVLEYEKMYLGAPGCLSWVLVAKKRYAGFKWDAWAKQGKLVFTGLECKRRDFCEHLRNTMKKFLLHLFTLPHDEALRNLRDTIIDIFDAHASGTQGFVLSRQFFKKAEEYANPGALPHVCVALRTNVNVGTRVEFLIADDDAKPGFAERAVTLEEFTERGSFIDVMYYFHKQFEKPLRRICDVVDATLSEDIWGQITRRVKKIDRRRRRRRDTEGFNKLFMMKGNTATSEGAITGRVQKIDRRRIRRRDKEGFNKLFRIRGDDVH